MDLEKYRHLIEPVLMASFTPVAWEDVRHMPGLQVMGANDSVILTCNGSYQGKPARTVWVAAGRMDEIRDLSSSLEASCKAAGIGHMVYLGRRGWVRAMGYTERAVLGVKEI